MYHVIQMDKIVQEVDSLIEGATVSPPPIDLTQPVWVQQERRIMYDIMAILNMLVTIASLVVLIYEQYRNAKV
jgi:hypothetical protein